MDILVGVVSRLASVVDLPDFLVGELGEDLISHFVIALERTTGIFLLDEIDSDCLFPFVLQSSCELGFSFFQGAKFQANEDHSKRKVRVILPHPLIYFIHCLYEFLLFMLLDDIALFVVFGQVHPGNSELDPIIAISDELPHRILDVLSRNVETPS